MLTVLVVLVGLGGHIKAVSQGPHSPMHDSILLYSISGVVGRSCFRYSTGSAALLAGSADARPN